MSSSSPRKVILDLATTLDGFIEGKNGETDWCIMDAEMQFTDFPNQIDTILYGRKSFDAWGEFNPPTNAANDEKEMWRLVHSKAKYVFSKTENRADSNTIYINKNIAEEVNKLKNQPGRDIWLYGGASLITTFIELDLVDEYRLSVHPVVLGEGKALFTDITKRLALQLIAVKPFSSGVVQLIYHNRRD